MRVDSIDQIASFSQPKVKSLNILKNLAIKWLGNLKGSKIVLIENGERFELGDQSSSQTIHVTVHDAKSYWYLFQKGTVGAGEAYMQGFWSCDNLTALITLMADNLNQLQSLNKRRSIKHKFLSLVMNLLSGNSQEGSKRNIGAHYDLGNDFFKLFLDDTMMYSSAIYKDQDQTLAQASVHKLDRICQKLNLTPGDHLMEIGTGWGGLAIHAASNYGCKVTTTTISQEQFDFATQKIKQLGLQDKITVLLKDYRLLEGKFDKLVSIEMIEAVGHQYYQSYFEKCNELLKSDGLMLIQAITISDQRYHWYRKSTDFIQKYIFPGGCLPSTQVISQQLSKHTDMQMVHLEDITAHYAKTLADWRVAFFDKINHVKSQGYDDRFIRMWEYYLCYCEGGFNARSIQTGQYVFAKSASVGHLN